MASTEASTISRNATHSFTRATWSASIWLRSSTSSIRSDRCMALRWITERSASNAEGSGPPYAREPCMIISLKPTTMLSGVRSSWLTLATNCSLAMRASSAAWRRPWARVLSRVKLHVRLHQVFEGLFQLRAAVAGLLQQRPRPLVVPPGPGGQPVQRAVGGEHHRQNGPDRNQRDGCGLHAAVCRRHLRQKQQDTGHQGHGEGRRQPDEGGGQRHGHAQQPGQPRHRQPGMGSVNHGDEAGERAPTAGARPPDVQAGRDAEHRVRQQRQVERGAVAAGRQHDLAEHQEYHAQCAKGCNGGGGDDAEIGLKGPRRQAGRIWVHVFPPFSTD